MSGFKSVKAWTQKAIELDGKLPKFIVLVSISAPEIPAVEVRLGHKKDKILHQNLSKEPWTVNVLATHDYKKCSKGKPCIRLYNLPTTDIDDISSTISHETIHHIISWTINDKTSDKLDNLIGTVDKEQKRFGFY